jgi:diguanylate cyclase (GGDEF)-like protein/PAS domain S-box-containing protein
MSATRRARASVIPLLAAAIALAGATGFAIASLRAHADGRREAQVQLAALRADVEAHTSTVWRAVASGDAAAADEAGAVTQRIGDTFDGLVLADPGEPMLLALIRSFGEYELASGDVLAGATSADGVLQSSVRAMRKASAALAGLIRQADASYQNVAAATSTAADIGTTTILVSAAVLLVLLFRRGERALRAALLLAHEQRVLRFSEERFRSLVQHSTDMITVLDRGGIVRYQSPSVERLLGVPGVELLGRSWRSIVHPDDASRAADVLDAAGERRPAPGPIEWRVQRADGGWLHLETAVTDLVDEPSVQGIVLNSRDVSERRELQERLSHQAFHDVLTGLPNRARFMEALQAAMRRGQRRSTPLAVLLLDLDQFKTINDSLGHAAGDELLIGVAGRLCGALRMEEMAARLAGDEFVVLLEDPGGAQDAARVAERIAASLRQPFTIMGKSVVTSASIGIVWRTEWSDPDELLRDADVAMYRAKAAGQHGYMLFEPQMHAAAVERLQDESDLREAVANGDLTLAYQPIIDLVGGGTTGVEALLRWRHPRHGDISPARFIPIAEETGLIHAIGWWVLETSCAQLAAWRKLKPSLSELKMSVNLSARQLQDPELPGRIADLLLRLALPPSALVLEMTEGAFPQPAASGAGTLAAIRQLGVRIAIDDFGTGYSTLGRLRELPVDAIKIDRSFVADVEQPDSAAIVRSLVDLARAMQLASVAEGVETEGQLDALRGLGCQQAQGYLLGRPAPAETAIEMLLEPANAAVIRSAPAGGGSRGNGAAEARQTRAARRAY